MFDTELVLWLQSLESAWLTTLLVLISRTADWSGYVVLALLLTFGVDFRYGFALFQMILWNGVFTGFLKELFALPRPAEVDSAVQLLGRDTVNTTPFAGMDGDHFLDLPDAEAVAYYRARADVAYGLPSGHVSMATSFWLGTATLFRKPPLTVLAGAMVVLVAVSRMYLGRHFLADVIGGFMLGLILVIGVRYFVASEAVGVLCTRERGATRLRPIGVALLVAVLAAVPVLLMMLRPSVGVYPVSRLLAANCAFAMLFLLGIPDQTGSSWRKRAVAASVAVTLYIGSAEGIEYLIRSMGWNDSIAGQFVDGAVPLLVCLLGTTWIGLRTGFFPGTLTANPILDPTSAAEPEASGRPATPVVTGGLELPRRVDQGGHSQPALPAHDPEPGGILPSPPPE